MSWYVSIETALPGILFELSIIKRDYDIGAIWNIDSSGLLESVRNTKIKELYIHFITRLLPIRWACRPNRQYTDNSLSKIPFYFRSHQYFRDYFNFFPQAKNISTFYLNGLLKRSVYEYVHIHLISSEQFF